MFATPQHNGIAERRNDTLLDLVRCMLVNSSLLEFLWGEILKTTAYILNQVLDLVCCMLVNSSLPDLVRCMLVNSSLPDLVRCMLVNSSLPKFCYSSISDDYIVYF